MCIGYSGGNRSRPTFGWIRNIIRKGSDSVDLDHRAAETQALAWTLFKKKLPEIVIKGIEDWIKKTGIPPMMPEGLGAMSELGTDGVTPSVQVGFGRMSFSITQPELAPPSGVMSMNYAR